MSTECWVWTASKNWDVLFLVEELVTKRREADAANRKMNSLDNELAIATNEYERACRDVEYAGKKLAAMLVKHPNAVEIVKSWAKP